MCEGWRFRNVVAHVLSYDELTRWQLVRRFVKGRLLPQRLNAIGVSRYASPSPEQFSKLKRKQRVLDCASRFAAVRECHAGPRRAPGRHRPDWAHDTGPEVTGPAEALLMAMAARPDALNQLTGPGKTVLAQRSYA